MHDSAYLRGIVENAWNILKLCQIYFIVQNLKNAESFLVCQSNFSWVTQ